MPPMFGVWCLFGDGLLGLLGKHVYFDNFWVWDETVPSSGQGRIKSMGQRFVGMCGECRIFGKGLYI